MSPDKSLFAIVEAFHVIGLKDRHTSSLNVAAVTIPMLLQRVRNGQRLVMTTAYDAVTARNGLPFLACAQNLLWRYRPMMRGHHR